MEIQAKLQSKQHDLLKDVEAGECFEIIGLEKQLFIKADNDIFVDLNNGMAYDTYEYIEYPIIHRNDIKIVDK